MSCLFTLLDLNTLRCLTNRFTPIKYMWQISGAVYLFRDNFVDVVSIVKGDLHFDVTGILSRLQKKTPLGRRLYPGNELIGVRCFPTSV